MRDRAGDRRSSWRDEGEIDGETLAGATQDFLTA